MKHDFRSVQTEISINTEFGNLQKWSPKISYFNKWPKYNFVPSWCCRKSPLKEKVAVRSYSQSLQFRPCFHHHHHLHAHFWSDWFPTKTFGIRCHSIISIALIFFNFYLFFNMKFWISEIGSYLNLNHERVLLCSQIGPSVS